MNDWRRISGLAVCFVVLLRMAIGWQFLYEGLWKLNTQHTSQPWTAAGYLKNAKGPFRDFFRGLAGDPDDLNWLDADKVAARWDAWQQRFGQHYGLDEDQQRRLDAMLNGPEFFAVRLQQWPEGIELGGSLAQAVRYDAEHNRLESPGDRHILPEERDALLKLADKIETPETANAFRRTVDDLYQRARNLSYKEKLTAYLQGDPEQAGFTDETYGYDLPGQIDVYKQQLAEYERNAAQVQTDFQHEHVTKQWRDLQQLRTGLVGPVKGLENELKDQARRLLNPSQLARGPVPQPWTQSRVIDQATMWGLTVLGVLLICGLFGRLSAVAAAALLASFYLAMPPWPGVVEFQELPGPEHSFLIDKNMIEVIALLAIAAMPTGRWFGVDALFRRRSGNRGQ